MTLDRRAFLLAGGASVLATGCGGRGAPADETSSSEASGSRRFRYGNDPSQFAELRMPVGTPRATVVLLHGGYWYPQYGLDQLRPMAAALGRRGYATWNVEYRRTGAGGGVPSTLADVAAAVDRLAADDLPAGSSDNVVLLGHSAGGHLAVWAASRTGATPGGRPAFPSRGAISLAGVLDLSLAATRPGTSTPVTDFVGGTPDQEPARYDLADPTRLVPAACPVWAVHAADDLTVPAEQSVRYVARDRAAGGTATVVEVPGDHRSLISPEADSYPTILGLVRRATA